MKSIFIVITLSLVGFGIQLQVIHHKINSVPIVPRIALFNYKTNILRAPSLSPKESIMRRNIQRNIDLLGFTSTIFFDDEDCYSLLEKIQDASHIKWLQYSYEQHEDGRIRSDMCRLAMLHEFGGYYFDNDIYMLANITDYIFDTTQFITVQATTIFNNPKGFFQAFVASVPNHPILIHALRQHVEWFTVSRTKAETEKITHNAEKPNLGTVFLRNAMIQYANEHMVLRLEKTGYSHQFRMQLFVEDTLFNAQEQNYHTSNLCIPCVKSDPCGFGVFDLHSGQPLFKSRIISYHDNSMCQITCKNVTCVGEKPTIKEQPWTQFRYLGKGTRSFFVRQRRPVYGVSKNTER